MWPRQGQALVERINLVKHFERRSQQNQAGGIIEREGAIALAKLGLQCAKCRRVVRVGYSLAVDGTKHRTCRRCQEAMASQDGPNS